MAPRLLASRAEAVEVAVGLLARMVHLSSFHLTLLGETITEVRLIESATTRDPWRLLFKIQPQIGPPIQVLPILAKRQRLRRS